MSHLLRRLCLQGSKFPALLSTHSGRTTRPAWNVRPFSAKPEEEPLTLAVTESCGKRLQELVGGGDGRFLRLSVEGGGCSGFQYKFQIDDNLAPDDKSFEHPNYAGAKVVVDPTSLEYLQGSTVDYQVELIRSAFRVVKNPKADHGCSCGASFTIKLD